MITNREFENQVHLFLPQLRSFLYRLTCDKTSASDLALDAVLETLRQLDTFPNVAALKVGVFTAAVRLAQKHPKVQWRFPDDALDQCHDAVRKELRIFQKISELLAQVPRWSFRVVEHISFCFTCMAKNLALENQITILLADIYAFTRKEIAKILGKSKETIQKLLQEGRQALQEKLYHRCSFINVKATCHYCAETNDLFNPVKDSQQQIEALPFAVLEGKNQTEILTARTKLIKDIDPLLAPGAIVHDAMFGILLKEDR